MEKTASLVQYYGMANGQVVLVTTEQLGDSPPMRTVYYIAEEDRSNYCEVYGP
jgi:hypothetical protein